MKPIMKRKIEDYDFAKTLHCIDFIISYSDITKSGEHHHSVESKSRMKDIIKLRFKGLDVRGIASGVKNLNPKFPDIGISPTALSFLCRKEAFRLRREIDGGCACANWILDIPKSKLDPLREICKSIAVN